MILGRIDGLSVRINDDGAGFVVATDSRSSMGITILQQGCEESAFEFMMRFYLLHALLTLNPGGEIPIELCVKFRNTYRVVCNSKYNRSEMIAMITEANK